MEKFGIEIKWAAYITLLSCLWAFFEKQLGMHEDFANSLASLLLLYLAQVIFIFIAFLDKRKNYYNNKWAFSQSFKFGIFLTGLITILNPLAQYIIYTSISPDYFENIIIWRASKYPDSTFDAASFYNLESQIRQNIQNILSLGIVFCSLFAYLLKNITEEGKNLQKIKLDELK